MWGISFKALILLIDALETDGGPQMETNPVKIKKSGLDFKRLPKRRK